MPPLILVNTVGLTTRLLAQAPRLSALAQKGWTRPLREVVPAVTCTAQATFLTFWGPMAGLPCTQWIARCGAEVVRAERPDLTLVYLPHLDYDTQRFGPENCNLPRLVRELDDACGPLLDAAGAVGAAVWVV